MRLVSTFTQRATPKARDEASHVVACMPRCHNDEVDFRLRFLDTSSSAYSYNTLTLILTHCQHLTQHNTISCSNIHSYTQYFHNIHNTPQNGSLVLIPGASHDVYERNCLHSSKAREISCVTNAVPGQHLEDHGRGFQRSSNHCDFLTSTRSCHYQVATPGSGEAHVQDCRR
jgi:hypothetical protein